MTDGPLDDGLLTLQEAADRLKVHYMTAYRWVRKGDLAAFKAGGRLRIRSDELARFLDSRAVDVALPTSDQRRTDWAVHVDRLHALLLDGAGVESGAVVRKVVADGAPAGEVYLRLLAPALHRIGEDWAAGTIGVAEEHRATEICSALMARLGDHFRRRGPSRGTAVTLTPPGDQHGLGAAMAADFLRAAGYEVHHLGANVPLEDLRVFLEVVPSRIVCASVTTPGQDASVYNALVDVAKTNDEAVVVVGGQGAQPRLVEAAGAHYLAELRDLPPFLEALRVG